MLSARLKSVDLQQFMRRRRTYPGLFPILHLDHIYYDGALEIEVLEKGGRGLNLTREVRDGIVKSSKIPGSTLLPFIAPKLSWPPSSDGSSSTAC